MARHTVREVMTESVISAYRGALFADVVRLMIRRKVSAMPVIDEERHVLGVVSESDLLAKEAAKATEEPDHDNAGEPRGGRPATAKSRAGTAEELMASPAVTVHPDTPIVVAARMLIDHRITRLPVTDHHGRLLGIAARSDLLRVFVRTDQQIHDDVLDTLQAVPAGDVSVRVRKGVVTLTGGVPDTDLIPIVIRLAESSDGVVDVISELTTNGPAGRPA